MGLGRRIHGGGLCLGCGLKVQGLGFKVIEGLGHFVFGWPVGFRV